MYEVVVGSELRGSMTMVKRKTPMENRGKEDVNWVLADEGIG